ncbi:MAG: GNAT family N-acetyltransferase [Deltaproteobacteria bacterium]|nr:GNAT family N-acetyltransferase [Deltaproteobacteria bacterium]
MHRRPETAAGRPPDAVAIRPATAGDEGFLRQLTAQAFGHLGPYEEWVASWLRDPRVGTSLVERAGQPAGFSMLVVGRSPTGERWVGDLLVLAVAPPHRRRGLGRALLEQAIEVCMLAGCGKVERWLELSVAADNEAARRLFERAGLAAVDVPTSSYPNGQRSIRLRRALT